MMNTPPPQENLSPPEIKEIVKITEQKKEKKLSAKEWFIKGLDAYNDKQFYESVTYYNKAIELNPKYANAYYNRGVAKATLGRYEEAIKDYDEAIELNPKDANAYTNRGVAKATLGRYEEAIEDYDEAIELKPKNAPAYYNKSCAYALQRDTSKALLFLEEALKKGYPIDKILKDTDWKPYLNNKDFKKIIKQYQPI